MNHFYSPMAFTVDHSLSQKSIQGTRQIRFFFFPLKEITKNWVFPVKNMEWNLLVMLHWDFIMAIEII